MAAQPPACEGLNVGACTRAVAYAYGSNILPNITRGSIRALEEGGVSVSEARSATVQKELEGHFTICITNAPWPSEGAGSSPPDPENVVSMQMVDAPNTNCLFLSGMATYEAIDRSNGGHFMRISEGNNPAFKRFVTHY